MFKQIVIPNFTSEFGYIRNRCSILASEYLDHFTSDFKVFIFEKLLPLLNDPDVPVQSVTAIAVQKYVQ